MDMRNKLFSLMPGEDCGLCQSSSCRVFARKLHAGEESAEQCPYLRIGRHARAMREIESIQRESRPQQKRLLEEFLEVKSCTADRQGTVFELQLHTESKYPYFDLELLESALLELNGACLVKSEHDMIRFQYKGKEILIQEEGRLEIEKAENREDAVNTFNALSKLLWFSRICPECASPAVDCAAGACIECADSACPVIEQGPKRIEWTEMRKPDIEAFNRALQKIRQLQDAVIYRQDISKPLKECRTATINLLEESSDKEAGVAFILYGISRNLERMSKTKFTSPLREIVRETLEAFNAADTQRALTAVKSFEGAFRVNPSSQEETLETMRVENNCRYISRVLMRAGQPAQGLSYINRLLQI